MGGAGVRELGGCEVGCGSCGVQTGTARSPRAARVWRVGAWRGWVAGHRAATPPPRWAPPGPPPLAVVMCHTASHLWSQAGCRHRGWRAPRAARSLRHEAAPCSPDSPPWAGLMTLCLGVASQLSTCWGGDVPPEKHHTEARVSATGLGARTTLGVLSTFEPPPLLTAKTGACETLM